MIKAYAALEPKGDLQPFEYDPGPLRPDEVEIDVRYCGICHSDLSMIDNEWGMSHYPLVPGHEVVGTIAQVGAQVQSLAVGHFWNRRLLKRHPTTTALPVRAPKEPP